MPEVDLVVLYEHPEWQKPLFAALEARKVSFDAFDLKKAVFDTDLTPQARLYFNQASPSAYVRSHGRAVPFALAFMRTLEQAGARVLNGARAFSLELSKSEQASMMRRLGIAHPVTLAFNDIDRACEHWKKWPALLKPEQGGSGARMFLLHSADELRRTLDLQPEIWMPDQLLLLQEYHPVDPARGIVRVEIVGGEFLYAMRVISHGSFNLCPSEVCHPTDGNGVCAVPTAAAKVEFLPYPEVPRQAIDDAKRIVVAGGLDVAGIEYLEAEDGRRLFYDVNANSNLRAPIARAFGFDPFERVVDWLVREIHAR